MNKGDRAILALTVALTWGLSAEEMTAVLKKHRLTLRNRTLAEAILALQRICEGDGIAPTGDVGSLSIDRPRVKLEMEIL